MKKIKKVFGRFYLNRPKVIFVSEVVLVILLFACLFGLFFTATIFLIPGHAVVLIFAKIFLIVMLLVVALISFLNFPLEKWAKELPEYFVLEARKILESNIVSPRLESLMERAKTGKAEGLNELKDWLKLFEDYKSLEKNLRRLCKQQEQQDKITREISASVEKLNKLQEKLQVS